MKTSDYFYELPKELIAQTPLKKRDSSRLLVLDRKKYSTIPILIQYFRGSYGRVEMGPMMACIVLTIIPMIIFYLLGQKYIIKGVADGAVKG